MTIAYSNSGQYIGVPITVNVNTMTQQALAQIAQTVPGWVARESAIEVILLEQFAAMASETAQVAAQVPVSIFAYFGTLVGINPMPGAAATVNTTWNLASNPTGYLIPAGSQAGFTIAGNQIALFVTTSAVTVPAGQTTTNITMQAVGSGSAYNGIAAGPMQLVSPLSFVTSVVSTAPTSGGADPETTAAYLNRLSNDLQYLAPRPILAADYAGLAANVPGVYRAMAISDFSPGRTLTDATVSDSSATLTCATANFTQYDVGRPLTDTDGAIPADTTIASIPNSTVASASDSVTLPASSVTLESASDWPSSGTVTFQLTANSYTTVSYTGISGAELTGCSGGSGTLSQGMAAYCGSQCTMSENATGSSSSDTVTLGNLTNQERTVAICAVDDNGNALSDSVAATLQAYFLAKREINFVVNVMEPTYSPINVTYTAYATPGQNTASLTSSVNAALTSFLSQANWGGGNLNPPSWDPNATTVYYNQVMSIIGSVPGIQRVSSLSIGVQGQSMGTSDITLPGNAPLTQVGALIGNVQPGS